MSHPIRLLVCDLDNTLYDWIGYFVEALYAMVDEAVRITGWDRERLLDDLRSVHQRYHDSEHPFSLLETELANAEMANLSYRERAARLDPAFLKFNSKRKLLLRLFPGVRETLDELHGHGIRLVAHTEGKLYSVIDRLRRLELEDYFDRIYCRERSYTVHPDRAAAGKWLRKFPLNRVVELSKHEAKPNPHVLEEIVEREGFSVNEAAYVGDSIARDVAMAKRANVYAVWAKYGSQHSKEDYAKLVRVSHWTSEEVRREKELQRAASSISPDYTAEETFSEVLDAIQQHGD